MVFGFLWRLVGPLVAVKEIKESLTYYHWQILINTALSRKSKCWSENTSFLLEAESFFWHLDLRVSHQWLGYLSGFVGSSQGKLGWENLRQRYWAVMNSSSIRGSV